tara:strand:+ start:1933 stop:2610 length:678 start_codon:yes stop_codon:yes gene_type:complete
MQIFILNGGHGKRVREFSNNKPKCLISFKKKPFIYYQLKLLKKKGINKIYLCLGYKSKEIIKYLKKNPKLSKNVNYIIENKKLNTGGALLNAQKYMSDYFLVTFGDSYLDVNYKKIFYYFQKKNFSGLVTVIKKNKIPYHTPNLLIKKNKIVSYKESKNFNFIDYGLMAFRKNLFLGKSVKKIPLSKIIKKLIKDDDICFIEINKKFNEIGSKYGIENFKKFINK